MTPDVDLEWRKAKRKLEEARALSADTTPDALVSSSYYAMYHAIIAALISANGTAPTKHGKLHQALVRLADSREGRDFADEIAFAIDEAYKMRIRADYDPGATPDETRADAERIPALRDTVVAFCDRVIDGR